jgi:AcrR family transcriptional regulator
MVTALNSSVRAKRRTRPTSDSERERVSDFQRARLLAGMAEVVAERGYQRVTIAHIVARSGVSRRTFYDLFDDREACFLAAFDHALLRAGAVVVPAYAQPKQWRERIRAGLAALLGFLDDEPALGRLMIVDSPAAGSAALDRRGKTLAGLIAAVDAGRGAGQAGGVLPRLTAEGTVGSVLSIVHTRLLERRRGSFVELLNPLMSMVVLPYLGAGAAGRELSRPAPERARRSAAAPAGGKRDPLNGLGMRLTYRTVRVLSVIASSPGASNRQVADGAGISDQGQISKLLHRLATLGLVHNGGRGCVKGEPNAWTLTARGLAVERAIAMRS